MKKYLAMGTEFINKQGRIGVVDAFHSKDRINVRYHNPNWPFPEWDTVAMKDIKVKPVWEQCEEAPL